jgi:hypothetical protein
MDPNSGKLYPSVEAAREAGVPRPVELVGLRADVERVSQAVRNDAARRRKRNRAAAASRRQNRRR